MTLNKKLEEFLKQIKNSGNKPFNEMTIGEMRQATKNFKIFQGHEEEIYKVVKKTIKLKNRELTTKIYLPAQDADMPVVLYFHSGGYVKGDIDYCEAFCRRIANGSHSVVVSVNYRLAPEHHFPAAVEDGYEALCWIHQYAKEFGGDPNKIAVMGESSGGNLAAVMSIMSHVKKGPRISFQILLYPQLDYTMSFSSHETFAQGYFLTKEALEFYAAKYLPENIDKKDQYVSPYWTKLYKYLPPAYIITAEYDPLQEEGEAYAKLLSAAGVRVVHHKYLGMIHGFISMTTIVEEAGRASLAICEALRIAFKKLSDKKSA